MKFDSVFLSPDLKDAMDHYSQMQVILNYLSSAFGVKIQVNEFLPLDSAVFVNHIGDVVGIYSDGKLVELPLDSAINYLARSPLAVKKKPLLE